MSCVNNVSRSKNILVGYLISRFTAYYVSKLAKVIKNTFILGISQKIGLVLNINLIDKANG